MAVTWADDLLAWFAVNARQLPWRAQPEPYSVWVAEVMLQQTRVETVLPYFHRWMARFPTVTALASAPLEEVLRCWEGLGYYRRAIGLHRAAQVIHADHQGQLPAEIAALKALPGIGPYTAAAIAAIAFGKDAIALDGNLRRVLSRLMDLSLDPRSPEGERSLLAFASQALPSGRAASFNQALMDLGAGLCRPRRPSCSRCPLKPHCLACQRGTQDQRPIRSSARELPQRRAVAGVLQRAGKVLLIRRPQGGLLGGLWGFPDGMLQEGEAEANGLRRTLREKLGIEVEVGEQLTPLSHSYTHFRVQLHPFLCTVRDGDPVPAKRAGLGWVPVRETGRYPMGKLDRTIASMLLPAERSAGGNRRRR